MSDKSEKQILNGNGKSSDPVFYCVTSLSLFQPQVPLQHRTIALSISRGSSGSSLPLTLWSPNYPHLCHLGGSGRKHAGLSLTMQEMLLTWAEGVALSLHSQGWPSQALCPVCRVLPCPAEGFSLRDCCISSVSVQVG